MGKELPRPGECLSPLQENQDAEPVLARRRRALGDGERAPMGSVGPFHLGELSNTHLSPALILTVLISPEF